MGIEWCGHTTEFTRFSRLPTHTAQNPRLRLLLMNLIVRTPSAMYFSATFISQQGILHAKRIVNSYTTCVWWELRGEIRFSNKRSLKQERNTFRCQKFGRLPNPFLMVMTVEEEDIQYPFFIMQTSNYSFIVSALICRSNFGQQGSWV